MTDGEFRGGEFWTGLFVTAALGVLLLGTLWISGVRPLGESRTPYEVLMTGSGGVRPGDQVRVSGVEVGRVREVRLFPGREWPVVIGVALDSDIALTAQSTARLPSAGLLGGSYLEILTGPPDAPPLPPGEPIVGTPGGGLEGTFARVDEIADRAVVLLDEVNGLVQALRTDIAPVLHRLASLLSEENVEEVRLTVQGLRHALDQVGPRLAPLVDRLDALARDLQTGARDVPQLTAEVKTLVEDLQRALGPDGERLANVLEAADGALGSADGALSIVEGKANEIEAMVSDMRQAAANLRDFSQSLKERPARVLRSQRWPNRKPGDGVEP